MYFIMTCLGVGIPLLIFGFILIRFEEKKEKQKKEQEMLAASSANATSITRCANCGHIITS